MDVQLFVYDLSKGLARQLSVQITGTFIEAIYHTAIVVGGIEYFYGHGIYRKIPGSTHHGQPMEILSLGKTELPSEVIEEYVQSLESIYTPEAYDLFNNNCNNFSQDMSIFLVGKDIPNKIRDLPRAFLATPMGQMMRGMVDNSLRSMTQAPDAASGQSAPKGKPTHPHTLLGLPGLQFKIKQPVIYKKVPPLEKLLPKLGTAEKDPTILQLTRYIKDREAKGMSATPVPKLPDLTKIYEKFPEENRFPFIDLLRIAAVDPRFSSLLATHSEGLTALIPSSKNYFMAPYQVQVVTLQLACNLFSSNVFQDMTMRNEEIRKSLANLISGCLLASHNITRSLAGVLLYNLMAFDHNERMDNRDDQVNISDLDGVEEALVQAVINESDKDTLHALLLSLGMLMYLAPLTNSIWDLCDVMEMKYSINKKKKVFTTEKLLMEIDALLSQERSS